jgi:two-component system sensor histidine kinase DctS
MAFAQLKLRTKIVIFSFGIVLLSVIVAVVAVVEQTTIASEKEIGLRAMAIARTVTQLREVQDNLGHPGGEKVIQPIAERIRLATGVEYIVIFDMDRIRYSHPLEDRIGTVFNDGDEEPSLRKQEYLSQAIGVQGPSIRAFVPVMTDEGTRQVGVVTVGILVPTFIQALSNLSPQLYSSIIIGLLFGFIGSILLARNIKKKMFSLEPAEIARILEERVAIFQSMAEGIIAMDVNWRITFMNDEACRVTEACQNYIGRILTDVIALPSLNEALRQGKPLLNQEIMINKTVVLASFLPIKVNNRLTGTTITFQDKTEIKELAEELTGVKTFIEALRVQNHESLNKLHTIAGLIQLQKYQAASDYIFAATEEQEEITRFLGKKIRDPAVAGILLGKYGRAKELRVRFFLDPDSELPENPSALESHQLVLVLGNLLENAMESVAGQSLREIHCCLKQADRELVLSVEDTGTGISSTVQEHIFEWGVTTKETPNRGIGLYLVKQTIDNSGGTIEIESGSWGTRFLVRIPTPLLPFA